MIPMLSGSQQAAIDAQRALRPTSGSVKRTRQRAFKGTRRTAAKTNSTPPTVELPWRHIMVPVVYAAALAATSYALK